MVPFLKRRMLEFSTTPLRHRPEIISFSSFGCVAVWPSWPCFDGGLSMHIDARGRGFAMPVCVEDALPPEEIVAMLGKSVSAQRS